MSLGFLESLPDSLATTTAYLDLGAYSVSFKCHQSWLQGCLDICVPENCLFAYFELISETQFISFYIYVYNTCIDTFCLLLLSRELIIGS